MQNSKLILFTRAAIKGKVKTRIANQFGNDKALLIHNLLFKHSLKTIQKSKISWEIYLSEEPQTEFKYPYKTQKGNNLGERMHNTFVSELANNNYVCIIGADCLELTPQDLQQAFEKLTTNDVVLGPANDGGYYLIGLKRPIKDLFTNIAWGTAKVMEHTLQICRQHKLSYALLLSHNDIDRPEDVPADWL